MVSQGFLQLCEAQFGADFHGNFSEFNVRLEVFVDWYFLGSVGRSNHCSVSNFGSPEAKRIGT